MGENQFAVISDIHGNAWALDAVLADIDRRGIKQIVNLGDSLFGPLDPAGTADRLMMRKIISVRGNQDRILLSPSEEALRSDTYRYVVSQLAEDHRTWLEAMPFSMVLHDEFFLCHATPDSDETCLLESITAGGVSLASTESILKTLHGVNNPYVLCGHSHLQKTVYLPTGQTIINPGSVGLPAYTDELPYPHKMESGSPYANYAIMTKSGRGWQFEHVSLPYEWQLAAAAASKNGRDDWAEWIATGRA